MAIKKPSRSSINIKGRFIIYGLGAGPGRGERNQTTRKGEGANKFGLLPKDMRILKLCMHWLKGCVRLAKNKHLFT